MVRNRVVSRIEKKARMGAQGKFFFSLAVFGVSVQAIGVEVVYAKGIAAQTTLGLLVAR